MPKSRPWPVMGAVFCASIAIASNQFKVPPVMQTLMGELDISMVTGGWLMSVFSVAGVVLSLPAALLLVRLGIRRAGLVAIAFSIAGTLLGALAPGAPLLLLGRVIEGVSAGLIGVIAPAAISQVFAPDRRGLPMGIWAAWLPIGNVIGLNAAHPLLVTFGWRAVWWSGAALSLLALGVFAWLVPAGGKEGEPAESPVRGRAALNLTTWLLALAFGSTTFVMLGFNTWAPSYLADNWQVAPARASFYASLMFLVGAPGNVAAGWLINRVRQRYELLAGGMLITALAFFVLFRIERLDILVPFAVATGFVASVVPIGSLTLAPTTMRHPEEVGLSLAMVSMGANGGVLLGPPVVGMVVGQGGWSAAGICLPAVLGVGMLAVLVARRRALEI